MMKFRFIVLLVGITLGILSFGEAYQPLSRIAIHKAVPALLSSAYVKASPSILGLRGETADWVTVKFRSPNPSNDDWIGVFSPANFSAATCSPDDTATFFPTFFPPFLCTSPIKYQFANYSSPDYNTSGSGKLKLQLINQRGDFSFALLTGGVNSPNLIAVSNAVTFKNPNAPVYPRLAQGKAWNEEYKFRASPYPGQDSVQRVVIFGDTGTEFNSMNFIQAEADGSNDYINFEPGSLNTTRQIIRDLNNIDLVFHIGDICYALGYLSQWDQFTSQVEPITSAVPYMLASGNHERDWPGTGSFYGTKDSGGECGVPAETMYYVPAENRAKYWYSTDYGMFKFCVANTELDWREGTEQYKFIKQCFASADRQKQPWLIFLAHRVLGYSSNSWYADQGSFGEPIGRESLQKLWQKYKVDIAVYGHVHNYERTCPIYENVCTTDKKSDYQGPLNGTIHVVAGGGGFRLNTFTTLKTKWSLFQDYDFGFIKLTAFDHSKLLFEYKKSRDGNVYDSFTISGDYRDILACTFDSCPNGFVPHDPLADCHMLDYACNNGNDCFGPCGKEYYPPKDCVALPTDPSGPHY
ncbi:hypothetical protein C5167_009852 [Papaver somniferum]|uniref:Purple acid phosphatase n=1 Tax=Papaver somniferum TaxID=3469 RepID=A0A4Y7JYJ0_PAPSO|nr:hypothetical protein C5167_009852 [Papaver somniferum]